MRTAYTELLFDYDILVLYAKNLIVDGEKGVKDRLMDCWRNNQDDDPIKASKYGTIMSAIDLDNELELTTDQLQLLLGVLCIYS